MKQIAFVVLIIVTSFCSNVMAVTTYADLYNDWTLGAGSDIPDQSGGVWQPYALMSQKLYVDSWGGFDLTANGIKERMFFEEGTFHDGKGWIQIGPKNAPDDGDRTLLSWYTTNFTGDPDEIDEGFCRFEIIHTGGAPVNVQLQNINTSETLLSQQIDANNTVAAFYGQVTSQWHWLLVDSEGADSLVDLSWIITDVDPDAGDTVDLTVQVIVEGTTGDPNTTTPLPGVHQVIRDRYATIDAQTFIDCPTVLAFDRWEGQGITDPNSAQTTVFMDQNRTVTAVFTDARQCGDVCHPSPDGDINDDCIVDLGDFAELGAEWADCTHPNCD